MDEECVIISSSDSSDSNDSSESDAEKDSNSFFLEHIKLENEDYMYPWLSNSGAGQTHVPTFNASNIKNEPGTSTNNDREDLMDFQSQNNSQSTADLDSFVSECNIKKECIEKNNEEISPFNFSNLTTNDIKPITPKKEPEWTSMKSPRIFNFGSKQKCHKSPSKKAHKYSNIPINYLAIKSEPPCTYEPFSVQTPSTFEISPTIELPDISSLSKGSESCEKSNIAVCSTAACPQSTSQANNSSGKNTPVFSQESPGSTQGFQGSLQGFQDSSQGSQRSIQESQGILQGFQGRSKSCTQKMQGPNEFEVEKIVDHEELTPERVLYKVKWKGFDDSESTWEPLENLTSCLQLVYAYKKRSMAQNSNPVEQRYQQLLKFLSQHNEQLLKTFVQRFCDDQGVLSIPKVDVPEIQGYIRNFARHPELIKTNQPELDYLREQILTSVLYEKRQEQLEDLKNYEMEINVTAGNAVAPIYVINNVDLEVVPKNFTHTSVNIPTQGVVVNEEPIIWCECTDNCRDSEMCCGQINDSISAYDKKKRLKITHGTPIYECNKNCKCNDSCPNRVIQLGTQMKLAIFKTYNDCGWGVQTLENIPKGTYVTEYIGEILTYKAASLRPNQTYLFNLDFNGSTAYVIDAGTYGNISHFINHSCDPNLAVFPAYIQCLDPNMHRLPMFAIRDIQKGEQLSFSYYKSARSSTKAESKKIKCKCDSKNCCGYLLVE